VFSKRPSESGILACYYYNIIGERKAPTEFDSIEDKLPAEDYVTRFDDKHKRIEANKVHSYVEFFDKKKLHEFLYSNSVKKRYNGVLQKFVDPKGERNETI